MLFYSSTISIAPRRFHGNFFRPGIMHRKGISPRCFWISIQKCILKATGNLLEYFSLLFAEEFRMARVWLTFFYHFSILFLIIFLRDFYYYILCYWFIESYKLLLWFVILNFYSSDFSEPKIFLWIRKNFENYFLIVFLLIISRIFEWKEKETINPTLIW